MALATVTESTVLFNVAVVVATIDIVVIYTTLVVTVTVPPDGLIIVAPVGSIYESGYVSTIKSSLFVVLHSDFP